MTFSSSLIFGALFLVVITACDGRRGSMSAGDQNTFIVESVSILNNTPVSTNHVTQTETTRFQFQACVSDAVARSPIQLTEFVVSDGTNEKTATTEPTGCLLWTETHEISALVQERVMRVRRFFSTKSGFLGTVAVDLGFNPSTKAWYDLRKFNDLPNVEPQSNTLPFNGRVESKLAGRDEIVAETYLTSASFSMRELNKDESRVDRLLTLSTVQNFDLTIEPKYVLKNLQGERLVRPMLAGDFKLSITVVREKMGIQAAVTDLIAAYDGKVSVREDGLIRQKIDLRVYDAAAALNHNNQMILTLEPTGENANFARVGTVVGYLDVMNANSFTVSLDPAGSEAENKRALAFELRDLIKQDVPRARDLFESKYGMKNAATDKELGAKLLNDNSSLRSKEACKILYTKEEKIEASRFWGWMKKTSDALTECLRDPSKYVITMDRDVVEDITGSPIQKPGRQQVQKTITMSSSLTFSVTRDNSYGWNGRLSVSGGVSGEIGLSGGTSFGNGKDGAMNPSPASISGGIKVGAGASGEVFGSTSYTHSETKQAGASVSQSSQLVVYQDSYDIPAKVRRCVFLRGITPKAATYFACEEKVSDKVLSESFYTVNYSLPRSIYEDDNSAIVQQWRLSMRGDDVEEDFEKIMTLENTNINFGVLFSPVKTPGKFLPAYKVSQAIVGVSSIENKK